MALAVAAACYSSPDFPRYEMPKVCRGAAHLCALSGIKRPRRLILSLLQLSWPSLRRCRVALTIIPHLCSRRGSRTRNLTPRTDDRSKPRRRPAASSASMALVRPVQAGGIRRGTPSNAGSASQCIAAALSSICPFSRVQRSHTAKNELI